MTLRLAVAATDASGRLRVGRLGLALEASGSGPAERLWPHRWHPQEGWLVLGPDRLPLPAWLPDPPPAVSSDPRARLRLPTEFCAVLHVNADRQLLAVCDGYQLWLLTADWLAPLLP